MASTTYIPSPKQPVTSLKLFSNSLPKCRCLINTCLEMKIENRALGNIILVKHKNDFVSIYMLLFNATNSVIKSVFYL